VPNPSVDMSYTGFSHVADQVVLESPF